MTEPTAADRPPSDANAAAEPIHGRAEPEPSPVTVGCASRREYVLFLLGAGVIALHIADDSFLQPEEGTTALDHLAGGLIPIGILAALAWVYPRLRAGARGSVSLIVGLLGVVIGASEAGYYTAKVGPSGDDYTGLLAIPAGLLLLVLGVVTIWRSRRRGDSLRRRYTRRALIAVAGAVVAFEVFAVAFSYAVTHVARPFVPQAALGTAHEDVTFTTSDGLDLDGWYVPSRNGAAVIAFPGRKNPQPAARMLARHGYGVLVFDRRGEGTSDGDPNVFGWGGEKDVFAAIEFLKDRPEVDPRRIGGIGFSVGGEMMLHAASQTSDLAAVVSEGAGTRTLSDETEVFSEPQTWWAYPFLVTKTGAVAVFSNTMPPPRLASLVPRIAPRPVFLIWSSKSDGNIMNPAFDKAAGEPTTTWDIPEAAHVRGIIARPEEYERRVVGFFDDALLRH